MTNKEAIEELKKYRCVGGTVPQEVILAIKALQFTEEVIEINDRIRDLVDKKYNED